MLNLSSVKGWVFIRNTLTEGGNLNSDTVPPTGKVKPLTLLPVNKIVSILGQVEKSKVLLKKLQLYN
jgi:hypothetical protein